MAKILVSLPEGFLQEVDRAARLEHRSRSGFVREAVARYLHHAQTQEVPRRLDPVIRRAVTAQDELRRQIKGNWDSAQEVRRWRDSRRR